MTESRPTDACCPSLLAEPLGEAPAADVADIFKALADPARVRLVSVLASAPEGEVCACDLPGWLNRSQPTVSHHLKVLLRAGIIEREQRGKWAWLRLRRARLAALCTALGGC